MLLFVPVFCTAIDFCCVAHFNGHRYIEQVEMCQRRSVLYATCSKVDIG